LQRKEGSPFALISIHHGKNKSQISSLSNSILATLMLRINSTASHNNHKSNNSFNANPDSITTFNGFSNNECPIDSLAEIKPLRISDQTKGKAISLSSNPFDTVDIEAVENKKSRVNIKNNPEIVADPSNISTAPNRIPNNTGSISNNNLQVNSNPVNVANTIHNNSIAPMRAAVSASALQQSKLPSSNLTEADLPSTASNMDDAKLAEVAADNLHTLSEQKKSNALKQSTVQATVQEQYKYIEIQTKKLAAVKLELAKLDLSLNNNIDKLRQEIEIVGREVLAAQQDFDAKEKFYLQSRKILATKKQRKQLLTAHLDYIILTNEKNKAEKLRELEIQLGIANNTTPAPPPPQNTAQPQKLANNQLNGGSNPFNGFSSEEVASFKI
jgi:hypothetical protein